MKSNDTSLFMFLASDLAGLDSALSDIKGDKNHPLYNILIKNLEEIDKKLIESKLEENDFYFLNNGLKSCELELESN